MLGTFRRPRTFYVRIVDNHDGTRTLLVQEDEMGESSTLDDLERFITTNVFYTAVEKKRLLMDLQDLRLDQF